MYVSQSLVQMCCEPGCTHDATYIAMDGTKLVCYCEVHGPQHGLFRGMPTADTILTDWVASRGRAADIV